MAGRPPLRARIRAHWKSIAQLRRGTYARDLSDLHACSLTQSDANNGFEHDQLRIPSAKAVTRMQH
jgi:hypothetical protein